MKRKKIPQWQKEISLKEIEDRLRDKFKVLRMVARTEYVIYLESGDAIKALYVDFKPHQIIVDGKNKNDIEKILKN